jgi:hypothetical protein
MSEPQLQSWREFFVLYPFDDYHRFHRPAALIASRQPGGAVDQIDNYLKFLQPEPVLGEFADSDLRTLAAFGIKPPRG